MKDHIKKAFYKEIKIAKSLIKAKQLAGAFYHLERAHVLGQQNVIPHAIAHAYMLQIGLLKFDIKEILGQIIRIFLGILGSAIGVVPTGNTGGSNVSAFKKMEIPEDLKKILDS